MAKKVIRSTAPIYAIGVTWLAWGIFLPLYEPIHYAAAAAASAVVFLAARKIWPDRQINTPEPEPEQKQAEAKAYNWSSKGGQTQQEQPAREQQTRQTAPETDPEVAALLAERDRAVGEMRRLSDSIADKKISDQIDHLEQVTGKILDHVAQNPAKLPQIRRFVNYYLPPPLRLLHAYGWMDAACVSGANIDGTKGRVEDIMDTIVKAFDQQLDGLFGDEALDISTDITVLEQMLAREGLGGMQMPGN